MQDRRQRQDYSHLLPKVRKIEKEQKEAQTIEAKFNALPEPVQALIFVGLLFVVFAVAGTATYPY